MSRRRALVTPLARLDLIDAALFIAEDNPAAADRFIEAITETIDRAALRPMIGRARPEIGRDIRSLPFRSFVIFYRPIPLRGIEVVRVLHGARDIAPLFDEEG